jgi:hypothetical protein
MTRKNLPIWQNLESMTNSRSKYISIGMPPAYHRISDKDLDEFIAIYRKEFGEEIDRSEGVPLSPTLHACTCVR